MPIGAFIGWLFGQFLVGLLIALNNRNIKQSSELATVTRQRMLILGYMLVFTSLPALIGIFIEMALS